MVEEQQRVEGQRDGDVVDDGDVQVATVHAVIIVRNMLHYDRERCFTTHCAIIMINMTKTL